MSLYDGACHCGAVSARFETAIAPAEMDVRADQCGFCRARWTPLTLEIAA